MLALCWALQYPCCSKSSWKVTLPLHILFSAGHYLASALLNEGFIFGCHVEERRTGKAHVQEVWVT